LNKLGTSLITFLGITSDGNSLFTMVNFTVDVWNFKGKSATEKVARDYFDKNSTSVPVTSDFFIQETSIKLDAPNKAEGNYKISVGNTKAGIIL
jgi:hypothetical protein